MTPSPPAGSLLRTSHRSRRGRVPGWTVGLAILLPACLPASLDAQSGDVAPRARAVERIPVPSGPELWVAELAGAGRVGITLVFPGGRGGDGFGALAGRLEAGCPGAGPVVGAGPDYRLLSLSLAPRELSPTLECLAEMLRAPPAGGGAPAPDSRDEGGAPGPLGEIGAHRTPSGALLRTLYAPAPVPGGSVGRGEGDPDGASPSHLVVAGPPGVARVARRASRAFQGLGGNAGVAEAGSEPSPRPPVATEVLLLDRPGGGLADVRVGELVLPGDHPDWAPLVVAREILVDRLRGGAWAFVELLRVRGPGTFIAGSRLPADAIPGAVEVLRREIETLRDRLVEPSELEAATVRLAGSFEVATAGAPALADQLARVAALGLDPEAVTGYPRRLASLTPGEVRRAAREHLDPGRLVIAAAGNGPELEAGLARFGPVRRIDAPPPPPHWPLLTVDGRRLQTGVSRYRVRIGGRDVGTARREVESAAEGRIRFRSSANVGEGEIGQEVEATLPALDFVAGTTTRGGEPAGSLWREGDRLVGTLPGGVPVSLPLTPGTVVSDLLEPTLWASSLEVGAGYRVPVAAPTGDAVEWAAVQVVDREEVTVPAGTFETLRVAVTGPEILTLWLRRDPPHRTVRLLGANGVVLELVEEGPPGS